MVFPNPAQASCIFRPPLAWREGMIIVAGQSFVTSPKSEVYNPMCLPLVTGLRPVIDRKALQPFGGPNEKMQSEAKRTFAKILDGFHQPKESHVSPSLPKMTSVTSQKENKEEVIYYSLSQLSQMYGKPPPPPPPSEEMLELLRDVEKARLAFTKIVVKESEWVIPDPSSEEVMSSLRVAEPAITVIGWLPSPYQYSEASLNQRHKRHESLLFAQVIKPTLPDECGCTLCQQEVALRLSGALRTSTRYDQLKEFSRLRLHRVYLGHEKCPLTYPKIDPTLCSVVMTGIYYERSSDRKLSSSDLGWDGTCIDLSETKVLLFNAMPLEPQVIQYVNHYVRFCQAPAANIFGWTVEGNLRFRTAVEISVRTPFQDRTFRVKTFQREPRNSAFLKISVVLDHFKEPVPDENLPSALQQIMLGYHYRLLPPKKIIKRRGQLAYKGREEVYFFSPYDPAPLLEWKDSRINREFRDYCSSEAEPFLKPNFMNNLMNLSSTRVEEKNDENIEYSQGIAPFNPYLIADIRHLLVRMADEETLIFNIIDDEIRKTSFGFFSADYLSEHKLLAIGYADDP